MKKKIKLIFDEKGNLVADFDGFTGDDCFAEAEKLRQALKKLGIEIEVTSMKRKPPGVPETDTLPDRQKETGE